MKIQLKKLPSSRLVLIRRPSVVIAVGLSYAAVELAVRSAFADVDFKQAWQLIGSCQAVVWIWWLLSPIASSSSWRFPLRGDRAWTNVLKHFCFALAFAALSIVLYSPVGYGLLYEAMSSAALPDDLKFIFWFSLNRMVTPSLVTYCLIVTVTHVAQQEHNLAKKEAELSRAQLEAVRMQMSPHFLFNALNSISALASSESPERASDLIARLGRALRESLAIREEATADLENELDMLEDVLEIERVRFGERLKVRIVATEGAMRTDVPRWLLQPLVENAIVHGIAPQEEGGNLTITARIVDRSLLELVVIDDGAGLRMGHSEGIGIGHTRRRLRALFGDRASLALTAPPEGGTRATLTIPVVEEAAAAA